MLPPSRMVFENEDLCYLQYMNSYEIVLNPSISNNAAACVYIGKFPRGIGILPVQNGLIVIINHIAGRVANY